MKDFDLNLLQEVIEKINKSAFVASPQTQEAAAMAQQEGLIQPTPPAPGSEGQPQIGFNEVAQLMQQGFEALMSGQEQLAQVIQQVVSEIQVMKMSGGGAAKKKSVSERLDQLEQMLIQAQSGATQPAPSEVPQEATQEVPQEQPPTEQQQAPEQA